MWRAWSTRWRDALGPDRALVYERGCEPSLSPAVVGGAVLRAPDGFLAETYAGLALEGPVTETQQLNELRMMKIGLSFEPSAGDWSMRVSGTVVPEETGIFQLALAQAGLARLLVNDEVVLDGFTNRPPAGRQRLLRAGQPGPSSPTSISRRTCRSTWSSSTPSATRAWPDSGWAFGLPTATRCWSERWPLRPRRTSPSSVSARRPRRRRKGATAPPWPCPDARPSWSGGSPRSTTAPSSWSMLRHRSTWGGRRTSPPCCSAGSAARRWPGDWWTCSSAPQSPAGACPPRSRCDWSTHRRTRTFPVRTASCATARACSWGTAAMSTMRSRRGSRSATA